MPQKSIVSAIKKTIGRRPERGQTWDVLARSFLTLGLFLIPLTVLPWTSEFWELPKAMVLLVTVTISGLCYGIGAFRRRTISWSTVPLDWLLIALGAIIGLSTLTSVRPWQSLVGISGWYAETLPVIAALLGLYALLGQLFRRDSDQRLAWTALLGGLGASFFLQMFQFSDRSLLMVGLPRARLFSTVAGSPTAVAVLAAIFTAGGLLFWPIARERWMRWSVIAAAVTGWLTLLLLGRPLGWAVFAIGIIIVVLAEIRRGPKANMRYIGTAIALAAAGLVVQLTGLSSHSSVPAVPEYTLGQQTSASIATATAWHRPALGSGPATWYQDFVFRRPMEYNNTAYWGTRFIKAGGEWWQFLATLGWPGLAVWLGTLLVAGASLWRLAQRRRSVWISLGLLVVVSAGVVAFFVTWSILLFVLLFAALGLLRPWLDEREPKSRPIGIGFILGFTAFVAAAIVLWYGAGRVFGSEVVFHQAQDQITAQKPIATIRGTLDRALQFNPRNGDASVFLANAYAAQTETAAQEKNYTEASKDIQLALTTMRTAINRDRENPAIYEAMNNLLNRLSPFLSDSEIQARQNFAVLRRLEPANPIHDVGYGQTLMISRGKLLAATTVTDADKKLAARYLDAALNAYAESLKKKPDYFQALFARAQANAAADNNEQALAEYRSLSSAYPTIAVLWDQEGLILFKLKRTADGTAAFERAISLDSKTATYYLDYAQALIDNGDTAKAKDILNLGLKAIPNQADLQSKLSGLK